MRSFLATVIFTINLITISQAQSLTFHVQDKYKKAPFHISKSPQKLAVYLTKNDSSEGQKVLNIYTWVVHNIKYDIRALKKIKSKTYNVKQTLRRKKGICYQYSNLFITLCKNVNISAKEIVGYSRGLSYLEGDTFYEIDHSWNGVKIDSAWYLVDVTWGSGVVEQRKQILKKIWYNWFKKPYISNSYKFKTNPNFSYFLVSPEKLIKDHLPADPSWQLIKFPISVSTYESNNWSGYKNVKDTSYLKKIDSSKYYRILNQYEFISNQEYLTLTASRTNIFNPKNYGLLGYSSFVNANSMRNGFGTAETIIVHKKKSIKLYKTAIHNSKKHQKTVKYETTNIINKTKIQIKSDLIIPSKFRMASTKQIITKTQKILAKRKKNIEDYTKKRSKLKNISSKRQYKKLQFKLGTEQEKPKQIALNKLEIDDELHLIRVTTDSITNLSADLDNYISRKGVLHSNIESQNAILNILIETSTDMIMQYQLFSQISNDFHRIDSVGKLVDTLYSKLTNMEKKISQITKSIQKLHFITISKSLRVQKLLSKNCQLTKGIDCQYITYNYCNATIKKTHQDKLNIEKTLQKMRRIDFQLYKKLNLTLIEQLESLNINTKFISQYQKVVLENTVFKKHRSDFQTNKVINNSNFQIKSLSKDINKLNHKIKKTRVN